MATSAMQRQIVSRGRSPRMLVSSKVHHRIVLSLHRPARQTWRQRVLGARLTPQSTADDRLASSRPDNDAQKRIEAQHRYQQLYSDRTKFMKEDMTGFVWLYLQKPS
jgi:hypothetical protein